MGSQTANGRILRSQKQTPRYCQSWYQSQLPLKISWRKNGLFSEGWLHNWVSIWQKIGLYPTLDCTQKSNRQKKSENVRNRTLKLLEVSTGDNVTKLR